MAYRLQIALVFLAPVLVLVALFSLGDALGVKAPLLGRGYVIRVALPEAGASVGLPEIQGPEDPARPLIVIDAGHGGHDPGASGASALGGVKEKTLALALARALRDRLLREGGVRVALTRDDDTFLVLEERAEIARALGADLFLSIHAASAGARAGVTGASVYTLSARASSEAAALFAARENSADVVNGALPVLLTVNSRSSVAPCVAVPKSVKSVLVGVRSPSTMFVPLPATATSGTGVALTNPVT